MWQGLQACPGRRQPHMAPSPRGKGRALHPGLSCVCLTSHSNPSLVSNKPCDPRGAISLLCDSVSSSVKWE